DAFVDAKSAGLLLEPRSVVAVADDQVDERGYSLGERRHHLEQLVEPLVAFLCRQPPDSHQDLLPLQAVPLDELERLRPRTEAIEVDAIGKHATACKRNAGPLTEALHRQSADGQHTVDTPDESIDDRGPPTSPGVDSMDAKD